MQSCETLWVLCCVCALTKPVSWLLRFESCSSGSNYHYSCVFILVDSSPLSPSNNFLYFSMLPISLYLPTKLSGSVAGQHTHGFSQSSLLLLWRLVPLAWLASWTVCTLAGCVLASSASGAHWFGMKKDVKEKNKNSEGSWASVVLQLLCYCCNSNTVKLGAHLGLWFLLKPLVVCRTWVRKRTGRSWQKFNDVLLRRKK